MGLIVVRHENVSHFLGYLCKLRTGNTRQWVTLAFGVISLMKLTESNDISNIFIELKERNGFK